MSVIFAPTVAPNTDDFNNGTSFRVVCKLATGSNGKLQITLASGSTHPLTVDHCSIGKWNGVANLSGTTAVPVEVKFGGVSGFTIGVNSTITSDLTDHSASFALAAGDSVVVIHDEHASTSSGEMYSVGSTNVDTYFKTATASWNSSTGTSFTKLAGKDYCITKVETNDLAVATFLPTMRQYLRAGAAPPPAPVVNAGNFNLTVPATTGAAVGTMTASGSPTSWAIIAGNSSGYFAINNSGAITVTSAGASGLVAGNYSLTVQATNASGNGSGTAAVVASVASGTAPWPGQPGNLVGHTNTPAVMPTFTAPTTWPANATWPGAYPGSLQGSVAVTSGTQANPRVIAFRDLDGSGFGDIHDVIFVGCRFQMTSDWPPAVQLGGTSCARVSFFYCSIVPLITAAAQPPNGGGYTTWPTGGWCSNAAPDNAFQISSTNGCFGGFELWFHPTGQPPVGLLQIDHCDIWGMGCAIAFGLDLPGGGYFTDNWMHDFPNSQPAGWHTNGLAQSNNNGVVAIVNPMVIRHNVIAGFGGSNALAFQNTNNSQFKNIIIDNNLIGGWGGIPIRLGTGNGITQAQYDSWVNNITFSNNTLSTGVVPQFSWLYGYETMVFKSNTNANGNRWFNNKLKVEPGTIPVPGTWTAANDGQYLLPTSAFSATDWT